ncbi:MAG: hypothetical protein ABIS21_00660 [Acidimicrobiales bacterium]
MQQTLADSGVPEVPSRYGRYSRRAVAAWAVGAWVAVLAVALVWGATVRSDDRAHVNAAPFVGTWLPAWGWRAVPAIGMAAAAVAWAPGLAARLPWRRLMAAAVLAGAGWAVALAYVDGPGALTAPLTTRYEYLNDVPRVASAGPVRFLDTFVEQVPTFATHVKSHPPGMVIGLWGLDRLGLGGPRWAALIVLVGGAAAVAAALTATREMAGEAVARRAAPFVALAPAAVFVATSPDALFVGVAAWGVALLVMATGREGRRGDALALGGGALLGAALFLSYGAVLLLPIPVTVALVRRRFRPLAVAALTVAAIAGVVAVAGFWWLDGLSAARAAYHRGLASRRPYGYFLVANLAVFAVLLSPATAAALTRLRSRRLWLVVGAALASVALADLSGLSKGEVERIWLIFVPWVVVACASLGPRARGWLAVHVGTGLALQVLLRSPW